MNRVTRLSRIELVSAEPQQLAGFYGALGFTGQGSARAKADRVELWLGEQRLDLLAQQGRGAPYPSSVPGWSPYFQHIAIVVTDMARAYARLRSLRDWTAISTDGPQRLPQASGGVTAFKFRDPEGHPLELIAFPPGHAPPAWAGAGASGDEPFLGIDHSAISVADTDRSLRFYEPLGLGRTGGSVNAGVEQARLDDVVRPEVRVTALSPAGRATPHLELLAYSGDFRRPARPLGLHDIAATRLVFALEDLGAASRSSRLRDPDGHLIVLEAEAPAGSQPPVAKPG